MINNKTCYFNDGKDKLDVVDNKVFINGTLIEEVNRGVDGIVYKYQDSAIKLYHDSKKIKEHLTTFQIDILSSFKMNHVVLPTQKLISDTPNAGFIMNYIDLDSEKDILYENWENVLKQIKGLEKELFIIGENNFLLEDMQANNLFYNGNLYLFDSDNLTYDKKTNFSRKNLELFSWYFMRDIIFSLNGEFSKKEQTGFVRKLHYLYQKGKYTSLAEFLNDNIYENNLNEFRKNFIKEKVR